MSRHADLERILQAWYDLEGCAASEKDKYRDALHHLLDEARAGSNVSRQDCSGDRAGERDRGPGADRCCRRLVG